MEATVWNYSRLKKDPRYHHTASELQTKLSFLRNCFVFGKLTFPGEKDK